MDFEEIRAIALKQTMEKVDKKIQALKEKGEVIPKVREFEIVFQNILTGFAIPEEVDDRCLDIPEALESLKTFVKERIECTSLNLNETKLFKEFVDHLLKEEDFVSMCDELLEKAHQEEPIYIYEYVKGALTRLLEARK